MEVIKSIMEGGGLGGLDDSSLEGDQLGREGVDHSLVLGSEPLYILQVNLSLPLLFQDGGLVDYSVLQQFSQLS